MAEFNFILSSNDQYKLVSYLLEDKAILVPALHYPNLEYWIISSIKEFKHLEEELEKRVSGPIFITWKHIESFPYEYDTIEKEGETLYYLCQRNGGPYLNFLPCKEVERDYGPLITSGFVGYYPSYWITHLEKNIPVSDEIIIKYKEITKFIRSISRKVKAGKRTYWVGHDALEKLRSSTTRASVDNLEIPV